MCNVLKYCIQCTRNPIVCVNTAMCSYAETKRLTMGELQSIAKELEEADIEVIQEVVVRDV